MSREPLSYAEPSTPPAQSGRGRGPVYLGVAAAGMLLAVIIGQSLAIHFQDRDLELFGVLLLPSEMAAIVSVSWAVARVRSSPRVAGVCVCLLLCYLCLFIYWFVALSDSGH